MIVPGPRPKLQATGVTLLDIVNAVQASNIIDSPGLYEADHQLVLGLVGAQAQGRPSRSRPARHQDHQPRASPCAIADVATIGPGNAARLHARRAQTASPPSCSTSRGSLQQ